MRQHYYDHTGNPVTAEDVLDGVELHEYRQQHPRPPAHQMRFYVNECDACSAEIPADLGAFCGGDHCPVVEGEWDRWLDRHDDISSED